MNEPLPTLPRSPVLMSRDDTALLIVDVQEKLLPHIADSARVLWNIRRLVDGAIVLGLPVLATEQYPKGLGRTVEPLVGLLPEILSKMTFSCGGCPDLLTGLPERGVRKVLVAGIEAHVCVQQTVLDLLADSYSVYVAVDGVGSRFPGDLETSLRRVDSAGAVLTTTESALFEWCETAEIPEFKEISLLVREKLPAATGE